MAATTSRASSAYASASVRPVAAVISPLVIRRMVAVTTSPTNAAGTCRNAPARVPSSISSRTRLAALMVFCS